MKKRILSILLALCMLFCLVPTTAFAEGETNRKVETEQELVDALADSSVDIITLKNDIAIGTTLTVLRKVTLDLNGYVLKMTGSGSVIILDNKSGITGDLTLIDSNPTAEHKFKVNGVEPWVLDDSGTETIYGGIIRRHGQPDILLQRGGRRRRDHRQRRTHHERLQYRRLHSQ